VAGAPNEPGGPLVSPLMPGPRLELGWGCPQGILSRRRPSGKCRFRGATLLPGRAGTRRAVRAYVLLRIHSTSPDHRLRSRRCGGAGHSVCAWRDSWCLSYPSLAESPAQVPCYMCRPLATSHGWRLTYWPFGYCGAQSGQVLRLGPVRRRGLSRDPRFQSSRGSATHSGGCVPATRRDCP
jgi:hypothetical protein